MMELLVTGQPMSARRAYELGFINRLTSPERLADETMALARTIIANAPLGVKAGRQLVNLVLTRVLDGGPMRSLRMDPQGKTLGDALLLMTLSDDALEGTTKRNGPEAYNRHKDKYL